MALTSRCFLSTRTVYLCHRRADNAELIMKQIPLEDMDAASRESAMKEVKILDKLKHPNIITLYDSFIHGASLCIVMEYAEGTLCGPQLLGVLNIYTWVSFNIY
jgi:serine/threonine protein kinase